MSKALELHKELAGKIEVTNKLSVTSMEQLSLLYSPGVADPCLEIEKDESKVYEYTWVGNTIAVVSNGTAVLGLGDIGAKAGLPVMEGKSMLFKGFAGVNAVPIMLDTKDSDEIIRTVEIIAPTFGGINLEDIKAPECVYIERKLKEKLSIPVFHDDQHGTAVVVMAGLFNAFKILGKELKDAKVVVAGTGAAGSSIIRMLYEYGVRNIVATNSKGVVKPSLKDTYNFVVEELCEYLVEPTGISSLKEAIVDADVFIGVSIANQLVAEDIKTMAKDAVVFALANPNPEIPYDEAIKGGAAIVGTGRSDYPNQVNNVLAFPGIFRGALDAKATQITEGMKIAAAAALAEYVSESELSKTSILPNILAPNVSDKVAEAVKAKAIEEGVVREK